MKKYLVLAILALSGMSIHAYDFYVDGIYYNFSGDEATVTYGPYASYPYSGSVVIPESVTYNGNTYSVTSIGNSAFSGCSGLTSIAIPNSVTSIGKEAFRGCSGLTSVHITDLTAWNNITFEDIESQPLYYAHHLFLNGQEITGDFVIPEYLTQIGNYAFCGCSGLTSVIIPESVIYIGAGSFYNCPRIKHIYVCSQMPADCGSNTTFFCKNGVRDEYDVYNYAILHVPMGSKEEYGLHTIGDIS